MLLEIIKGYSKSIMLVIWVLMGVFNYTNLWGQKMTLPQKGNYFVSPVNFNYVLSANFGELRTSHFHTGLDLKSSGKAGDSIFSVADGYVSRIKISAGGYGLAVYIDHPDIGYTTVYAHLADFDKTIANYVRSRQMSNESFEIDVFPQKGELPVKRGQLIGIMGNTGHSFGNHLHFEIRETRSEVPMNPYLFGFGVSDNSAPLITFLSVHGLNADLHKIWEKEINVPKSINDVITIPDTVFVPSSSAGFAVGTFDRSDGSTNRQGIYRMCVYINDLLSYEFVMDEVSFSHTGRIRGFTDYSLGRKGTNAPYLGYKLPGNDLGILNHSGNGVIPVYDNRTTQVKIELEDFAQNSKVIYINMMRQDLLADGYLDPFAVEVDYRMPKKYEVEGLSVNFTKNSLFRNIQFSAERTNPRESPAIYRIHDTREPIKTRVNIGIEPDIDLPEQLKDKAIIVKVDDKYAGIKATWQDGKLTAGITSFGNYSVGLDTIAPFIKPISLLRKAQKLKTFKFEIRDNSEFGTGLNTEKIKAKIDGKFIISPFDLKSNTLEVPIKDVSPGSHELVITAYDNVGNESQFTFQFEK